MYNGGSNSCSQIIHRIHLHRIHLSLTMHSANVFAEELFQEAFAKDHKSQAAWNRFRRGILEYGGSRSEREVLEEFLGRPPTVDALIRSLNMNGLLEGSIKTS
jgi:peptidase M3-like protein